MCVLTVYFFRLDRIKFNYIGPKTCYRIWGEGTMNEHVTNLPYFQNINRFLVFIDFGMADSRESKAKDCVKEKSLDECIKGDDKDNIVRNNI